MLRMKEKGMLRREMRRLKSTRCVFRPVSVEGFTGTAGLTWIDRVEQPWFVTTAGKRLYIAREGYTWLQLAPEAGEWWLTVMYDRDKQPVQYYFDITLKNFMGPEGEMRFLDLFLDVVINAEDGSWEELDREELDLALERGAIDRATHALALERARRLERAIDGREAEWRALCRRVRETFREEQKTDGDVREIL